jgi:hypothetical protein
MNDDVRPASKTDAHHQPDHDASSDGDRSWTEDPITVDPHEDRSVDAVIARTQTSSRPTDDDETAPE